MGRLNQNSAARSYDISENQHIAACTEVVVCNPAKILSAAWTTITT